MTVLNFIDAIFIFIIGLMLGSFNNVCIWRLPRNESIFYPLWSYCPHCKNKIKWYDNIPLVSYILLRGKCRYCKGRISYRYFVIELISGVVLLLFWLRFGLKIDFFITGVLSMFLIIISGIDFMHRVIYDEINISLFVVGVLFSPFNSTLGVNSSLHRTVNGLLGSICGGALFYVLSLLGERIFKREALGGGDVKFIFALGTFLGAKLTLLTIFLGSLFGSIFSIICWVVKRKKIDVIPYAPFLSLGAICAILLFS